MGKRYRRVTVPDFRANPETMSPGSRPNQAPGARDTCAPCRRCLQRLATATMAGDRLSPSDPGDAATGTDLRHPPRTAPAAWQTLRQARASALRTALCRDKGREQAPAQQIANKGPQPAA